MVKKLNKIEIIFPLYNEENRLHNLFESIKKFEKKKYFKNINFVFVNDGSSDNSLELLKKNKKKNFKIISYKKNMGKGYAIKKAIKSCSYEWILTIDVDLSVELNQIIKWSKKKEFYKNKCYFGSRNHKKSKVKSILKRRIIGKIMHYLLKIFLKIKIRDTQCGFKLYNKSYAREIFTQLNTDGFAHDIELVLLLKKRNIEVIELPVSWQHHDGSKVNIITDSLKFLLTIFHLKQKYLNHH